MRRSRIERRNWKSRAYGKRKGYAGIRSAWERARVCFSKKKGVVRPRTTPAVVLRALQGSWPTLEKSDDESSSTTGSRNGHSSISISRESFSLHLSLLTPGRENADRRESELKDAASLIKLLPRTISSM